MFCDGKILQMESRRILDSLLSEAEYWRIQYLNTIFVLSPDF